MWHTLHPTWLLVLLYSSSSTKGLQSPFCMYVVRLTHCHHRADHHHCSYQVLRQPFVRNVALQVAISVCYLCVYQILSYFLEVFHISTNDTRKIIITIMYWFHGSTVSVSFSLHNCGTTDKIIAAKATSWAVIHHPPCFFLLSPCWTMLVTLVGVIRLIQMMKRKHKINVLFIVKMLCKQHQNENIHLCLVHVLSSWTRSCMHEYTQKKITIL